MATPLQSVSSNAAAEHYRGAAGHAYHGEKRALNPAAREWVWRLRAEKFQARIKPSDTVLELGAGAGWNLARLNCARRIGCEIAEFLAPELDALGIKFVADIRAVPSEIAEVALCHHALEHLLDPAEGLRQLARVLRPAGLLVLHVPWETERRYARFDPSEPNRHLFHWNAQNLGNLALVSGWRIERVGVRHYGYDRFAAQTALRLRLGEGGFRLLRRLCLALRPFREVELIARRPAAG
jgi:SAM-dependent methyltransferase